jgi:ribonuclease P protein subunit RPR2
VIGSEILRDVDFLGEAKLVVRHHHERWDGTGYPDGLAGEAIPLAARVFAVADALDALNDDRPYRAASDWPGRR